MSQDLKDLVSFMHHGNTNIRQLAVEHLVPYSSAQPSIFKSDQLLPVRDLKLLVRDYEPIAKNAVTILINLSADREILELLAGDDKFLESLFLRLCNQIEPNANLIAMLFANLAKWDDLKRILSIERAPVTELSPSPRVIDQILDLFVKGADGAYNKDADFDYLAYFLADIARHPEGRQYFTSKQDYDNVIPLTKLIVFTEHKSDIRRKGVASTIKNVAFDVPTHPSFFSADEINIFPYILLPIMGNEDFDEEEVLYMLPDLQFLPPDKTRDSDSTIIHTHIETLMLLAATREGRDVMRAIKVYPIIRETHLQVDDDDVREACERLVQLLMRGEEGNESVDDGMVSLSKDVSKPALLSSSTSLVKDTEEGEEKGSEEEEDDDRITEV